MRSWLTINGLEIKISTLQGIWNMFLQCWIGLLTGHVSTEQIAPREASVVLMLTALGIKRGALGAIAKVAMKGTLIFLVDVKVKFRSYLNIRIGKLILMHG